MGEGNTLYADGLEIRTSQIKAGLGLRRTSLMNWQLNVRLHRKPERPLQQTPKKLAHQKRCGDDRRIPASKSVAVLRSHSERLLRPGRLIAAFLGLRMSSKAFGKFEKVTCFLKNRKWHFKALFLGEAKDLKQ